MLRWLACLGAVLVLGACGARRSERDLWPRPSPQAFGLAPGTFEAIDQLLDDAERDKLVPGGVLTIRKDGALVYERAFGRLSPDPGAAPMRRDTIFDQASITKAVAAVPMMVLAKESGFDPEAGTPASTRLLDHSAGIRAIVAPRDLLAQGFDAIVESIESSAAAEPCDRYSNAAYVLLAWRLAKSAAEAPGDRLAREVWQPMGVSFAWSSDPQRTAPSGRDAQGRWLRGTPYDPLADAFVRTGRIKPLHSGLFATSGDVALFLATMLEARDSEERVGEIARLLFGGVRGLPDCDEPGRTIWRTAGGIECPTDEPLADIGAPPGTVFHLSGYCGTFFWVHASSRTVVVLSTNATAGPTPRGWVSLRSALIPVVRRSLVR